MGVTLKVLSFGGGVQSTTLALMAATGEIERPDCCVFADAGNESEATYAHVWRIARTLDNAGIPLYLVSAGVITDDVLRASKPDSGVKTGRIGQPPFYMAGHESMGEQRLWRKCSSEYKIRPIEQFVRARLGVKKGAKVPQGVTTEKWIGISTDEASRMKPSRLPYETTRWPLIEMGLTRWDCHIWLKRHGWGVVPSSACLICPYHDNDYWRELRDKQPDEYQSVVDFERELHAGQIPGTKSAAYLHRSCVPLDQVDLSTDEDRGQYALDLWGGECEGICGT